ncbi:hypothetical protein BAUCODRAFT_37339 [Baudoinia panamericana UAMH 10762]|uniref:Heterokaryon incompatibility domain-containing protein n=1 Tax=Baudoinia panamericana (strain UAMH 10762) TaxID=717646 RepID=M2N4J4_BAUPA|nr:uncharacterized protein BAUCODRAFT_37339 [Baudoinia panamericana UAMH 10762]EMC93640.1 hypothetical protein BAUCODRAFT_37339 [Baudoinia panamericana UAMH 10762]
MVIPNDAAKSVYDRLPIDGDQLRLVGIQPGKPDADVVCSLDVYTPKTSYRTLSYCWGAVQNLRKIQLEGVKFQVTPSLYDALTHLRHDTETVWIWIDAICINQESDDERSRQVERMGAIFGNSTKTTVWLGVGFDEQQRAVNFLNFCAQEFVRANGGQADRVWEYSDSSLRVPQLLLRNLKAKLLSATKASPMLKIDNWKAVGKLAERPWWRRLWVLQEAVLAKEVSFQCGHATIDLISLAMLHVLVEFSHHLTYWPNEGTDGSKLDELAVHIQRALGSNEKIYEMFVARTQHQRYKHRNYMATFGDPLFTIAQLSYRQAHDPRDKLYAVKGLMSRSDVVHADYKKSLIFAYPDFASDHAKHWREPFLRILSYAGIGHGRLPGTVMASWIPDWRLYEIGHLDREMPTPLDNIGFQAGKEHVIDAAIFSTTHLLVQKGVIFDRVTKRASMGVRTANEQLYGFDLLNYGSHKADSPYPGTGTCRMHALLRTLLADCWSEGQSVRIGNKADDRTLLSECMAGMAVWYHLNCRQPGTVIHRSPGLPPVIPVRFLKPTPGLKQQHDTPQDWGVGSLFPWSPEVHLKPETAMKQWPKGVNLERAMNRGSRYLEYACGRYTKRRTFFGTEKGYYGLGPANLQEGDIVCVFHGCNIPHLLRQKENMRPYDGHWWKKEHEGYEHVGEAYVHGIMDGEAIDQAAQGNLHVRDFLIGGCPPKRYPHAP